MNAVIKARFVYAENKTQLEGTGFIIETSPPFYVATILKFKDPHAYLASLGGQGFVFATVPGYQIIIQFAGSLLHGRRLETKAPNLNEIQSTVDAMADFYFLEKIKPMSEWIKKKFRI